MNFKYVKNVIKKYVFLEGISRRLISFVPYKLRKLDRDFWDFYYFLFAIEKRPKHEVQEYQFMQLCRVVQLAYAHSSFYRKKYDEAGFHPSHLKTLDDIKKIPILTKVEVRSFSESMVLDIYDIEKLYKGNTSGTTGKALQLYFDQKTDSKEWASICYQWKRVGYEPGDGRVEFRGFIDKDLDYLYLPDVNVLRINIVKLSEENLSIVIKKIEAVGYKFLHGYPSAIWKFASLIKRSGVRYQPQAIMMASEILYEWQMQIIDEVFSCAKTIHYGQAEKVALASWLTDRKYYFVPAYGILECNSDGRELIATSLINEVMPFIRYKLTDCITNVCYENTGSNGTFFPIADTIQGREEDNTFDTNGNLVPPAIVTFPFKQLQYIESAKIIQLAIGDFKVILETKHDAEYSPLRREIAEVVKNLTKIYGARSNFEVSLTDKIPVDPSGKFRWIECKINA
ncbi:hypothetical protein [Bdellovibrio bacteriovorus]|uniref:hypothetical protein n=1 Tax=Bdellovibrio bacteriovorus TaxID=959 RepID=UPI0035A82997